MPETVACTMCGSNDLRPELAKAQLMQLPERYGVKQCRSCGFHFLSPRPTAQELIKNYNTHPFWGIERAILRPKRRAFDRRRLIRLERRTRGPGRLLVMAVLEGGYFLDNARRRGWDGVGVEFVDPLLAYAQGILGLNMVRSPLWDMAAIQGRQFDAIYTHSLEHVPNPSATLRGYHGLLRDDGILMIEAPNQFEAMKERLKEALWAPLGDRLVPFLKSDAPPEAHLSFFSPRTLRRALEQNGYEVLELRTFTPWNPSYHLEHRGRTIRELVYFLGGLIGRGPSTEVIARRCAPLPAAAGTA